MAIVAGKVVKLFVAEGAYKLLSDCFPASFKDFIWERVQHDDEATVLLDWWTGFRSAGFGTIPGRFIRCWKWFVRMELLEVEDVSTPAGEDPIAVLALAKCHHPAAVVLQVRLELVVCQELDSARFAADE